MDDVRNADACLEFSQKCLKKAPLCIWTAAFSLPKGILNYGVIYCTDLWTCLPYHKFTKLTLECLFGKAAYGPGYCVEIILQYNVGGSVGRLWEKRSRRFWSSEKMTPRNDFSMTTGISATVSQGYPMFMLMALQISLPGVPLIKMTFIVNCGAIN